MRVIICGGRDYQPTEREKSLVKLLLVDLKASKIVSGGYGRVDSWGESLARELELPVEIFKANWNQHGKGAGPIRNMRMAQYADACIALTGNDGTDDMCAKAKQWMLRFADLRDGKCELSWKSNFV